MEIDRESRFLIWLDVYFLVSIVTGIVVYEFAKNFIATEVSVYIGLSIGLGVMIGTFRLLKKRKNKVK